MWQQLLQDIISGDSKAIGRSISLIENEAEGFEIFLQELPVNHNAQIIGITGSPGAGKSTLTDALIGELLKDEKKVAVLCVDPSSPFNFGALLGDRIRMSAWYNNPNVFIRSLATRGSLGGLHPKIIEITDVMKSAGYDHIIIETVGVGQSEIEISGLADVTIVVLVPEGGDVIQTMKAGIMEIADIFVVNKSDRPEAERFVNDLKMMLSPALKNNNNIPVLKTIASEKKGIKELKDEIKKSGTDKTDEKKNITLAQKAWQLIQNKRMKNVNKEELLNEIKKDAGINIYKLVQKY